jgi:hypothetical protein
MRSQWGVNDPPRRAALAALRVREWGVHAPLWGGVGPERGGGLRRPSMLHRETRAATASVAISSCGEHVARDHVAEIVSPARQPPRPEGDDLFFGGRPPF